MDRRIKEVSPLASRAAALTEFDILDTPAEQSFEDIVALASLLCGTSVALVSLLDTGRQWFKARVGVALSETPLSVSICAFAVEQQDLFIIPDLTLDARTAANPLVTGESAFRFYAGAQLRTPEGVAIGTLCVLDETPRPIGLTADQARGLRGLANQVMALLDLRRAVNQRDRALASRDATEQRLRQDAARNDALFALHKSIDTAGDLEAVLRHLVDGSLALVGHADGAAVEFIEGDELVYRAVAGSLAAHQGERLRRDASLSGLSITEGRPLQSGDAEHDPRVDPEKARKLGLRSVIVVPILRHGVSVGVLKVQSGRIDAFEERDVQIVQLLAAAAAAGFAEIGEAEARKSVERSEARYRSIFESAVEFAIVATDLDGTVTHWNEGAHRIIGWTPAEMIGQPADRFFTDTDREAGVPRREMGNALTTGRSIDERWHLRKDGSLFWASGEMMRLQAEDGAAIGFVKILRDRTAQREAEEHLRQNEERLAFAFDAAGAAGWWDWDIGTDRVYANARFAELYGIDPDQAAAGAPVADFVAGIHPRDRVFVEATIRRALATGDDFAEEYRLLNAAGVTRWVIARGRCFLDEAGQPLRFPGVAIDITARKESERLQGALLTLGDRLRDAEDAHQIARAHGEILVETLDAGRAGFARFDEETGTAVVEDDWSAHGLITVAGTHDLRSYGLLLDDLKAGRLITVPDVAIDARTSAAADAFYSIGVSALVNVPIIERGRLVSIFFVHSPTPRQWSLREVNVVREAADRTRAALARAAAEERQRFLNQELSHRMKNTLSMVQGIARQTMRNASSLEAARETLPSRLMAFGKAHDLLLSNDAEATRLTQIITGSLTLHDDGEPGRFALDGPDIQLGAKAALSLALMLHELATNAVKYGALSVPAGRIAIRWRVVGRPEDPDLSLRWEESGGPVVRPPARRGFGSTLIERGLTGSFGGTIALEFEPTGVVCEFTASLFALRSDQ